MARVMRDATVEATATKLFGVRGPSWIEDSYDHWSAVVKAWAVGATRPLHDEDRREILYRIQELDEAEMERRRALENDGKKTDGEASDEARTEASRIRGDDEGAADEAEGLESSLGKAYVVRENRQPADALLAGCVSRSKGMAPGRIDRRDRAAGECRAAVAVLKTEKSMKKKKKKHFSELLAERASRHHRQEAEDVEEVHLSTWERTKRMWERIEKQLHEQK